MYILLKTNIYDIFSIFFLSIARALMLWSTIAKCLEKLFFFFGNIFVVGLKQHVRSVYAEL